jgi:hypothetical protein
LIQMVGSRLLMVVTKYTVRATAALILVHHQHNKKHSPGR